MKKITWKNNTVKRNTFKKGVLKKNRLAAAGVILAMALLGSRDAQEKQEFKRRGEGWADDFENRRLRRPVRRYVHKSSRSLSGGEGI